jgi:hypothetical protein
MRLNGWQRIGIAASCLWAVGGAFLGNNIGLHEGDWVVDAYRHCLATRSVQPDGSVPADTDWAPCRQAFDRDWPGAISIHWLYAAIVGLVSIPLGWLIVYGVIVLVRWIRAGFKSPI